MAEQSSTKTTQVFGSPTRVVPSRPGRFPVPAYVYTSLTWSPDMRWLAFSLSREPPICRILDEIAWAPR